MHECKRVTAGMFVVFVLGFPSQVFQLSDMSSWAAAKTKTHSTSRSETITWSIIYPSALIKPRPSCCAFTPIFLPHPPKFQRASLRGGFLVLTPLSHCPEWLGESLHVRALLRVQINRTQESRCIFFALPVSAGPSNHLWSTILISTAFIHHTCNDFQITVPSSRWCQRHSAPRPHQTLHLPPLMSWFHNVFWTRPVQVQTQKLGTRTYVFAVRREHQNAGYKCRASG